MINSNQCIAAFVEMLPSTLRRNLSSCAPLLQFADTTSSLSVSPRLTLLTSGRGLLIRLLVFVLISSLRILSNSVVRFFSANTSVLPFGAKLSALAFFTSFAFAVCWENHLARAGVLSRGRESQMGHCSNSMGCIYVRSCARARPCTRSCAAHVFIRVVWTVSALWPCHASGVVKPVCGVRGLTGKKRTGRSYSWCRRSHRP